MGVWDDINGGADRKIPVNKKRKSKQRKIEKKISYEVAEFLVKKYPTVEFRFDIAADIRLTVGQSAISKEKLRHKRGYHDLTILEARGGYFGLLIELKKEVSDVYRLDGKLKKSFDKNTGTDHNVEQSEHLASMRSKGYWAGYGFGLEHTLQIIDEYMNMPPT